MKKFSYFGWAMVVSSGLAISSLPAFSQTGDTTVIEVPADLLGQALAACDTAEACRMQINALIAKLQALYAGVPLDRLVAAVAVEVAAAYNSGALSPTVAAVAFGALAELAGTTLKKVIIGLVSQVEAGEQIDLEAVAEGGGSPN